MMKSKEMLIEVIEKWTVEPYKRLLMKEIQASIRLKTNGMPCYNLGKTKLGGCPDFPKNIPWARSSRDNRCLSFLGQVNLTEVKMLDELDLLPKSGLLYFFFDIDSIEEGKVIFSKEETGLERANLPDELKEQKKSWWKQLLTGKDSKKLLKESQVEIYKEYNIPSWSSFTLEKIQKETRTDIEPVNAFKEGFFEDTDEAFETETTSNHHLLGNYQGIQNELLEAVFLDSAASDLENLTLDEINKALKWKLLFQFDSDKNLEFSWGDWGRVYFFIHEDDLKKQNFNNVKISVDCY